MSHANDCVRQEVLLASGKIVTVSLHASHAPYARTRAQIENLCGYFAHYVDTSPLAQVGVQCLAPACTTTGLNSSPAQVVVQNSTSFGRQKELYHIEGNVTVHQGRASFMGARGHAGLSRLAKALRVESASFKVHMVVLCMKLGCRAHVTSGGLLEANLSRWDRQIRVHGRILEQANILRFKIKAFDGEFRFQRDLIPDNNDWAVTGRGTVLARMTWSSLRWTPDREARIVEFTERVGAWLTECCSELQPRPEAAAEPEPAREPDKGARV